MSKTRNPFRQHDVAPTGFASPLYRHLAQEWVQLQTSASTRSTLRRWARTEPALAGFARPGDIVDAIDSAPNARKNEILLALIRQFQGGQQLAGRTVLQAMLPKLAQTSAHTNPADCTSTSDTWAEDRRHITIGDFWEVMTTYPVERRKNSVAANLAFDTLRRVTGVREQHYNDVPLDPSEFVRDYRSSGETHRLHPSIDPLDLATIDKDPTEDITAEADLIDVMAWGVKAEVISLEDARLLAAVYLPDDPSVRRLGYPEAVEKFGCSMAMARKRCHKAIQKLKGAMAATLEPHAGAALEALSA
ncbi:hypothetical protein ACQFYA_20930 [Promicromonospora sp. Marseille-Q5078]